MGAPLLWDELNDAHPLAARLALLSCLPVRVAPALLRLARVRLLPQGGTGDEADLWLSDLVEARSAAGFAYRREVRDDLRQRLRAEAGLLDEVWQRIHLEHAPWLTPRARLEEELAWRLLRDRNDEAIDALWAGVVDELAAGSNIEGVARWVVRAVPDLPEGTLDHHSGQRAYFGAHLILGDASVLGSTTQQFLATSEFAFATRRLPRRQVFVGLDEDRLIVSPLRDIDNGHRIDIPATRPLWLQLEHGSPSAPDEVVTILGTELLHHALPFRQVTLRSLDGAAHLLAPLRKEDAPASMPAQAARVQIEYDVEVGGAEQRVELPFVTGVLADLAGHPLNPLPVLAERSWREIDSYNFDAQMSAMRPRLAIGIPNALTGEGILQIDLVFGSLGDFSPIAVANQVANEVLPLSLLLSAYRRVAHLLLLMSGNPDKTELDRRIRDRPIWIEDDRFNPFVASELGADAFDVELGQLIGAAFELTSTDRLSITEDSVGLARRVLGKHSPPEPFGAVQSISSALNARLSAQLTEVLHHPEFQRLEGAWLGLHYVVQSTESSEQLKTRFISVSRKELAESLLEFEDSAEDASPLFDKVYTEPFGHLGGQPFGCLVADFAFDHSPDDMKLLSALATIAAAAHLPLIAAAAPTLMAMESWQELVNPRDIDRVFTTSEYEAWRHLRESDDARYIGLAMPRVLARMPYGANTRPVEDFSFEEAIEAGNVNGYTWMNAAYVMAANIQRSFKRDGWFASICGLESGGAVDNLPAHVFPQDIGGVDMTSPVEIGLSDRRETELARNGLMPLMHRKGSAVTAFIGGQSLHKPEEHSNNREAYLNAVLGGRWPYLLPCCRFLHYLQCMARDKIGSFAGTSDLQDYLNRWLQSYVDGDPAASSQAVKVRYPLARAWVELDDIPAEPHAVRARFFVQPQYQLEGLTEPLELVQRLPRP